MLLVEVVKNARQLSNQEKLELMQLLAEDLNRDEPETLIKGGMSYPIWSPYNADAAAAVLLRELEKSKAIE